MREEGTVVSIDGRVARVRMAEGPRCEGCCACARSAGSQPELEVTTDVPLQVGARVAIEVAPAGAWLSTLLLFVLPLLGLVGGVIVGEQWQPFGLSGSAAPLVLGFGLLVVLFVLAAVVDRMLVRPRQPEPTIVEVLTPGAEEPH